MNRVTISDAEWQVMNVVWELEPTGAQEIVASLGEQSDWAASTIKTMLHRLVRKGVLTFDTQGSRYVYRATVRQSDCVRWESRSFLQRVFDGEPASLLSHFLRNSELSATEIADLRRMLDEQEAQP